MSHTVLMRAEAAVPTPPAGHATLFVDVGGLVRIKLPDGSTLDVGAAGGGSGGGSDLVWNKVSPDGAVQLEVGMITAYDLGTTAEFIFPPDPADGDRVALLCTGATDSGNKNNARLYLDPGAGSRAFEDYDTRDVIADNISDQSPEVTTGSRIRAKSFYLEYRFDEASFNGVWRLVAKIMPSPSRGSVVLDGGSGNLLSSNGGIDVANVEKYAVGRYGMTVENLPMSYANNVSVSATIEMEPNMSTEAGVPRFATVKVKADDYSEQPGKFWILVYTFDPGGSPADVDRLYIHVSG